MDKNWLFFRRPTESGETTALLNLDLVQSIEIVSQNSLILRFNQNQTISIEGQLALDLVKHLMTRVVRLDQQNES